jgi:hypothetical protein
VPEFFPPNIPTWTAALLIALWHGVFYLFCVFVGALDAPTPQDSRKYRYWFRVLNELAGNRKRAQLGNGNGGAEKKESTLQ